MDFLPFPPPWKSPPSQNLYDIKIQVCIGDLRFARFNFGFFISAAQQIVLRWQKSLGKKQVLTRDKLDLDGKEPAFANTCLYTFKIPPPWKTPNFHLNKICESLIYLLAETHHLFLQTKHNKLSGNFKRMSEYFPGKFVFLFWWKLLNSMQSELICCILNKPSPL